MSGKFKQLQREKYKMSNNFLRFFGGGWDGGWMCFCAWHFSK